MKTTENTHPATEQIIFVPRIKIRPSPLNPRTVFPDDYLDELGLNIRNNGLINALTVREKFVGAKFGEYPEDHYELVAGECRWRACDARKHPTKPGEVMSAFDTMPVVVRDLTDAVVLELMLSENMKRRDLSPLEEMSAFCRMLEQKDGAGHTLHTAVSLAEKIGVSENYVRQRLALWKLSKLGRKALADGKISFRVARTICACPKSLVELVEDEVLNPKKYDKWRDSDDALTADETLELIHNKYVRELRGAPFALTNATLVPVHTDTAGERADGGACADCPWNTANQTKDETAAGRTGQRGGRNAGEGKFCLNPSCFQKKVDVHVAAELLKAQEQGCKILSEKESEKVIYEGGNLHCGSNYVKLDEKPGHGERAHNVAESKCPTWGKLVTGETTPPVVIAVDKRGHVHRLVEKKLAITAAQENKNEKYLNLSSGRGRSGQDEDQFEQRKKDLEKQKERVEISRATIAALVTSIEDRGVTNDFWEAAKDLAIRHAGHTGVAFICKRRGIEAKPDAYKAARKTLDVLKGSQQWAMIIELLLSQDWSGCESPYSGEGFPSMATPILKLYGVDAKAIEATTKKAIADRKKAKEDKSTAKGAKKAKIEKPPKSAEDIVEETKESNKKAGKAAVARLKKGKSSKLRKTPISARGRAKIVAALKARWAKRGEIK